MTTYYLVKWKGSTESKASWEMTLTLWQFEMEVKAFEAILLTRMSASSGGGDLLGALLVADDGMGNKGAWTTLGQSLGFMFFQHIDGSSCQISNAPKGSLRGTCLVSLFELNR